MQDLNRKVATLQLALPSRRRARVIAADSPDSRIVAMVAKMKTVMHQPWMDSTDTLGELAHEEDERQPSYSMALPASLRDNMTDAMRALVCCFLKVLLWY